MCEQMRLPGAPRTFCEIAEKSLKLFFSYWQNEDHCQRALEKERWKKRALLKKCTSKGKALFLQLKRKGISKRKARAPTQKVMHLKRKGTFPQTPSLPPVARNGRKEEKTKIARRACGYYLPNISERRGFIWRRKKLWPTTSLPQPIRRWESTLLKLSR